MGRVTSIRLLPGGVADLAEKWNSTCPISVLIIQVDYIRGRQHSRKESTIGYERDHLDQLFRLRPTPSQPTFPSDLFFSHPSTSSAALLGK